MIRQYLTIVGYSTGRPEDVAKEAINFGGQCEDGLKMVVQIGEIPTAPGMPWQQLY